jgi:hypothetical protein
LFNGTDIYQGVGWVNICKFRVIVLSTLYLKLGLPEIKEFLSANGPRVILTNSNVISAVLPPRRPEILKDFVDVQRICNGVPTL